MFDTTLNQNIVFPILLTQKILGIEKEVKEIIEQEIILTLRIKKIGVLQGQT